MTLTDKRPQRTHRRRQSFAKRYSLPALAFAAALSVVPNVEGQVPGLIYTENGYDHTNGDSPICWTAPAHHNETKHATAHGEEHEDAGQHLDEDHSFLEGDSLLRTFAGKNWKSDLVPSFVAGPTTMLGSCPSGTSLHLDEPQKANNERLRTGHNYTYHFVAEIDLAVLRKQHNLTDDSFFYSSNGHSEVSLRLIFCPLSGTFCSPFIFSADNREADHVLEAHVHIEGDNHVSEHGHDHLMPPNDEHHDDLQHHDEEHLRRRLGRRMAGQHEDASTHEHEDASTHEQSEHSISSENAISSQVFFLAFDNRNQTQFLLHLDLDVQVSQPGFYLPLATVQFFLSNDTIHGHEIGIDENAAIKFDVANLLHQRSIAYYAPVDVLTVYDWVAILSYVLIGIAGTVQFVLLAFTVRYRREPVMKLSQGLFLVVFQIAGLIATSCAFLFEPKSDAYCHLSGPLVLIPLQFMLAVIYGRLRRIIAIMEPLMDWNTPRTKKDMKERLKTWSRALGRGSGRDSSSARSSSTGSDGEEQQPGARRWRKATRPKRLRVQYTASTLWIVIFLVTLPQVVVQIVGFAVFPRNLVLTLNEDESTGRYECGDSDTQWYQFVTTGVLFITLVVTLFFAQRSRILPAIFNEAASVSNALLTTLAVGCIGVAVVAVSDSPDTPPGIPYIMMVIVVLNATLNLTIRLVLPKLKLIWSGEKTVAIHQILADHRKSQKEASCPSSSLNDTSQANQASSVDQSETYRDYQWESQEGRRVSWGEVKGNELEEKRIRFDAPSSTPPPQQIEQRRRIKLSSNQAPPRELTTEIVVHSRCVQRVNGRVLTGLQVHEADWKALLASVDELKSFLDVIEFDQELEKPADEDPMDKTATTYST